MRATVAAPIRSARCAPFESRLGSGATWSDEFRDMSSRDRRRRSEGMPNKQLPERRQYQFCGLPNPGIFGEEVLPDEAADPIVAAKNSDRVGPWPPELTDRPWRSWGRMEFPYQVRQSSKHSNHVGGLKQRDP